MCDKVYVTDFVCAERLNKMFGVKHKMFGMSLLHTQCGGQCSPIGGYCVLSYKRRAEAPIFFDICGFSLILGLEKTLAVNPNRFRP